jgi:hypothetical protein
MTTSSAAAADLQQPVNASGGGVVDSEGRAVFGMDAEVALKRQASFDPRREFQVRAWLEAVLGERLNGATLVDALADGRHLCRLAELMRVDIDLAQVSARNTALHNVANLQLFLAAMQRAGVLKSAELFNPHRRDAVALVGTLEAVARVCAIDDRFSHVRRSLPPVALQTAGSSRRGSSSSAPTTSARKWAPVQTGSSLRSVSPALGDDAASLRAELVRVQHDLAYQMARCEYLESQLNSDGVRVFCLRVRCCPTWSRTKRRVVMFGVLLTGVVGATLYYFNANPSAAARQITPMLGNALQQAIAATNSAMAQVQQVVTNHIAY